MDACAAFATKPGPDIEPIVDHTINGPACNHHDAAHCSQQLPPRQVVSVEREVSPPSSPRALPCYGFTTEAYWRDNRHSRCLSRAQSLPALPAR